MAECVFCGVVAGEISADVVYEDEEVCAFRDISPLARVHVLVVPKVHYEGALELAGDAGLLASVLRGGGEVARREGVVESGYRFVFNTGDDAGRTVFHAHMHVLGGERLSGFGR
ncbi:histidine triad nucleotide-binding protein [Actinokineospora inagensis]|uniref:histidine triad nucleotide-binding protein n=1 Tax=Actinokineospora inagensis TaxID=103730 RepID=UPI00047979C3|nr:histidine triad nucleotide-binding protein [Actinokineospora inagensis]